MSQIEAHLFKSLSDAIPYGVCLVDLQGKIVYWNAAAEGITGYLGHEVLGRVYRGDLLVHCEDTNACTEVRCPVTEVLHDGRSVAADLFLRHKDGHRLPVHVFAVSLRDSAGEIVGVGEIFDSSQPNQESSGWTGHSEREFEIATGMPAVEESRGRLQALLQSPLAPTSAVILIEMSEQKAILQHGGSAMLHQSIRVLAKTVAGLLPPRHYVGCWSDWRLVAIIPECKPEALAKLQSMLAGVGSSCAVKWWGDRVVLGMRTASRYMDSSQTADELIQGLERDLKSATDRIA